MKDILKAENVKVIDSVNNAKQAIEVTIRPLVEGGYCEERYISEIYKNMEEFGPYFVLSEDLALLHARSDQGAIKTQLSIVKLQNPFSFSDNGISVRVMIGLVAPDSFSHMKAIKTISTIFRDHGNVMEMIGTDDPQVIYEYFIKKMKEVENA